MNQTNHLWDEYHNIINLVFKQIIWNSPWSIVNDKLSHVFYFVIPHHHSLVHGFTSYDLYPVCFLGHVLTGSLSYYLVISSVFSGSQSLSWYLFLFCHWWFLSCVPWRFKPSCLPSHVLKKVMLFCIRVRSLFIVKLIAHQFVSCLGLSS